FCAVVARLYSRFSRPRKTSLNWFMPALVKSKVGSPCGTSELLRTRRWPLDSKNRRNVSRISLPAQIFRDVAVSVTDSQPLVLHRNTRREASRVAQALLPVRLDEWRGLRCTGRSACATQLLQRLRVP